MDMSRAIIGLALVSLFFTACRLSPVPPGGDLTSAGTIGLVPYAVAVTPGATAPPAFGDQPLTEAEIMQWGAHIYAANCAPCHHPNGEGNLTTFPPLNRRAFVTLRAPQPVIDTVLHGREIMPAFAPTLNDAEVAAVLSYIRNSWNNDASFVDAEQVSAVRSSARETANETAQE